MLSYHFEPATFVPIPLHAGHIDVICGLLEIVRLSLSEEQRHFLKPRSHENLSQHFIDQHGAIGILNGNGQLVACALLRHLGQSTDAYDRQNFPDHHFKYGHWAVQSVAVHPEYGSKGLMAALLGKLQDMAMDDPLTYQHFVAKVSRDNWRSGQGFTKMGFSVTSEARDPVLGHPVVYFGFTPSLGLAQPDAKPLDSQHHGWKRTLT